MKASFQADPNGRPSPLPRKPQRKNGYEKYERLLDALEHLLNFREASEITLADMSNAAGVPTASVYHFFPCKDAALIALTERLLQVRLDVSALLPEETEWYCWESLLEHLCDRFLAYFKKKPALEKVRFGPKTSWAVRNLIVENNELLAEITYRAFSQSFALPESRDWLGRFTLAITISESFWSLAYTRNARIDETYASEAKMAAIAYLRTYIGAQLEPLGQPLLTPPPTEARTQAAK